MIQWSVKYRLSLQHVRISHFKNQRNNVQPFPRPSLVPDELQRAEGLSIIFSIHFLFVYLFLSIHGYLDRGKYIASVNIS